MARDGYPTIFRKKFRRFKGLCSSNFDPTIATIQIDFSLLGSHLNLPATHKYPHLASITFAHFFTNSKVESPTYQVSTQGNRLLLQNQLSNLYYINIIHPTPHDPRKNKVWQSGKCLIPVQVAPAAERCEHQKSELSVLKTHLKPGHRSTLPIQPTNDHCSLAKTNRWIPSSGTDGVHRTPS